MSRCEAAFLMLAITLAPVAASGQSVSQQGFVEATGIAYPQTAASDSTRLVGEALLRYEVSAKPASWLRVWAGVDARGDSHEQTRWGGVAWSDRSVTCLLYTSPSPRDCS